MPDHEHGQQGEYGLVMPFVVVESKDGPYEDLAYTAGFEAGTLDQFLHHSILLPGHTFAYPVVVRTDNVPQLDLIAMKHGLSATFEESETEGWSFLTLDRGEA